MWCKLFIFVYLVWISSLSSEIRSSAASSVPSPQIAALQELYNRTGGLSWKWRNETVHGARWNFTVVDVDPCTSKWQGITCSCDNSTAACNIVSLSLVDYGLLGFMPGSLVSISTLQQLNLSENIMIGPVPSLPTANLQLLDLSQNQFTGTVAKTLWQMTKLVTLDLHQNNIKDSFPQSIGNLSALRIIDVSYNLFSSALPSSFFTITTLESVKLASNLFSGTLSSSVGQLNNLNNLLIQGNLFVGTLPSTLSQLKKLVVLNVGLNTFEGTIPADLGDEVFAVFHGKSNHLTGTIPDHLFRLPNLLVLNLGNNQLVFPLPTLPSNISLRLLDLALNHLTGTLPVNFFDYATNLRYLYLSFNKLEGTIPTEIGNLRNLRELYLDNNKLIEKLPASLFSLPYLHHLALEGNHLTGPISPLFSNLTSLLFLDLSLNLFTQSIPLSLCTIKHLILLGLSANSLTGTIPVEIGNLHNLSALLLDGNQLNGTLPTSIRNLKELTAFYCSQNLLTGHAYYAVSDNKRMFDFTISSNFLSGVLPFDPDWAHLYFYSVYSNVFSGTIPHFNPRQTSTLYFFDVGTNMLTGTLPTWMSSTLLNYFYVDRNYFHGTIPPLGHNLQELWLNRNRLTGSIPVSVGECSKLYILRISHNYLTGTVPVSINRLPYLYTLFLHYNRFVGPINNLYHSVIQRNIAYVDISNNFFTGTISGDLFKNATSLQSFAATSNCLSGAIPHDICNATGLLSLALDGLATASRCRNAIVPGVQAIPSFTLQNTFTGGIPTCIFGLPQLQSLHVSGNVLTGRLPYDLYVSPTIQNLSIAFNRLSGPLPAAFQSRTFANLDFSYNRFSGILSDATPAVIHNGSYRGQRNRFSGRVPISLHSALNISLLDGNLFACDILQNDLPDHDPKYGSYSCGSDQLNRALVFYILLWVVGLVLAFGLVARYFRNKRRRIKKTLRHTTTNDTSNAPHGTAEQSENQKTSALRLSLPSGHALSDLTLDSLDSHLQSSSPQTATTPTTSSSPVTSRVNVWRKLRQYYRLVLMWRAELVAVDEYFQSQMNGSAAAAIVTAEEERNANHLSMSSVRSSAFSMPFPSMGNMGVNLQTVNGVGAADHHSSRLRTTTMTGPMEMSSTLPPPSSISMRPTVSIDDGRKVSIAITRHLYGDVQRNMSFTSNSSFENSVDSSNLAFPVIRTSHIRNTSSHQNNTTGERFDERKILLNAFLPLKRVVYVLTGLAMVLLMPTFVLLTYNFSTFQHSYAWAISALLLSGFTPGITLCVVFCSILTVTWVVMQWKRGHYSWYFSPKRAMATKDVLFYLSFLLANIVLMLVIDVLYVLAVQQVNRISLFLVESGLAIFKVTWNEVVVLRLFVRLKPWFYEHCLCWTEKRSSSGPATIGSEGAEDKVARRLARAQRKREEDEADKDRSFYDLLFQNALVILNLALLPAVAIAFASSNCFYNVLVPPPTESAGFEVELCEAVACIEKAATYEDISYDAPFIYSYQCSSFIIINYAAVYVYFAAIIALFVPLGKLALKLFVYTLPKSNPYRATLIGILPPTLRPLRHEEDDEDDLSNTKECRKSEAWDNETEERKGDGGDESSRGSMGEEEEKEDGETTKHSPLTAKNLSSLQKTCKDSRTVANSPSKSTPAATAVVYLDKNSIVVRMQAYITILLLFGITFPPLAVLMGTAILILVYFEETLLGRLLYEARRQRNAKEYHAIRMQIRDTNRAVRRYLTQPMLLWFLLSAVAIVYMYLVFDTIGDQRGLGVSTIAPALLVAIWPTLIFAVSRTIYWYFRPVEQRQLSAVQNQLPHSASTKSPQHPDAVNSYGVSNDSIIGDVSMYAVHNPIMSSGSQYTDNKRTSPTAPTKQRKSLGLMDSVRDKLGMKTTATKSDDSSEEPKMRMTETELTLTSRFSTAAASSTEAEDTNKHVGGENV